MKNWIVIAWMCILAGSPALAENYLINGGQESRIHYQMTQKIHPAPKTRLLKLSYVIPTHFNSPTYRQKIENLSVNFTPEPSDKTEKIDPRGNSVVEATWNSPTLPVSTAFQFTALNSVALKTLQTDAPFPLLRLPEDVHVYLNPTQQAPSDNNQIASKARELTASASTEFDAVQRILTWVVDHMHYILTPEHYDAEYSFQTGKGNCQNYSHLSAAMMRAVGIPVRIVNGITLKEPYDVEMGHATLTMKMAQGRHSWIEVFFPDLGWVPFDPQGTQLFVSNRFIRVEVGIDNNETVNDGLIRWSHTKGAAAKPGFEEHIYAEFPEDRVVLSAKKTDYGPSKLLLSPVVEGTFSKQTAPPKPLLPEKLPDSELRKLTYTKPHRFGNLDFPEHIDFLSAVGPVTAGKSGTMEMRKNFLVETAEYVTTQGKQFAQIFILDRPMRLEEIGLALHRFNEDGQLWLELSKDQEGHPGDFVTTSDILSLNDIRFTTGYAWVDFDFRQASIILSPGRYWVALGFTGSPVVNWFFSYGKPVGPQNGTRYKMMFDDAWSRSLAYEFNYRVVGFSAE